MRVSAANAAEPQDFLAAVIAWRDRVAQPDLRGLPRVSVPGVQRLRKAVPDGAAQGLLAAAYATSLRLSQRETLLRQAQVDSLDALRLRPLADCDAHARRIAQRSGWVAGGSGAALGIAGAAGLVADAPALLLIALRTLMRIGYCYGELPSPALVAALFALASADTVDEKNQAWQAALTAPAGQHLLLAEAPQDAAVRDGLERAVEREFAKQALTGAMQKLATTLVQRLGVRKAAGLLPVVGALVGGAVNIRFVYLLAEAARMAFTARRLLADGLPLAALVSRESLPAEAAMPRPRRKAASGQRKAAKPPGG